MAPVAAPIAAQLAGAAVRHLDETGFRIGGRTRWLHSVTALLHHIDLDLLRTVFFALKRGGQPPALTG